MSGEGQNRVEQEEQEGGGRREEGGGRSEQGGEAAWLQIDAMPHPLRLETGRQ